MKRAYRSPVRAQGAQETRRRILAAARLLFATKGYGSTTVEAVAAEAGVAIQTVYQAFRNKAALATAQLDALDDVGGLRELRVVLDDPEGTPAAHCRAGARFLRRLYESSGGILLAAQAAGPAEPELWRILRGGLARHAAGISGLTKAWQAAGALRSDISQKEAAAIVATVSGFEVHHRLRNDWRWSAGRYEAWLARSIERLVLDRRYWSNGLT